MRSWRTTVLGVISILVALLEAVRDLVDLDTATNPDWNLVFLAIATGIGLIWARDNDKSSETVGAK